LMGWRAASFFLEIAFRRQKVTAKLLNDAFYATLYCQIKTLPWSDPGRVPGRAEPPAEGNLMLRLDMLIAKNQDLFLYEDIENLIKETLVDVF
ncbi:MAG TPA: hypothetical protein VFH31_18375, partial [Pyrinomonadaceae bacterium]|nr:hypothetical protein [Pyrinomonadaceae bacterium]